MDSQTFVCNGPFCNGKTLDINRFYKSTSHKSGYEKLCKMCSTNKNNEKFVPGICERCQKTHDCSFGTGRFCSHSCASGKNGNTIKICYGKECEFRGLEQPIENFYNGTSQTTRRRCRKCQIKAVMEYTSTLEGYLKDLRNGANRRSRERGAISEVTYEYLLDMWNKQDGRCAISGRKMTHMRGNKKDTCRSPFNASIDRIDSSKGYILSNVHLICCWLQSAKLDFNLNDVKSWIVETSNFITNKIFPDEINEEKIPDKPAILPVDKIVILTIPKMPTPKNSPINLTESVEKNSLSEKIAIVGQPKIAIVEQLKIAIVEPSKEKLKCIDCGTRITKKATRCDPCYKISIRKCDRPPLDVLLKEIKELGYTATGRKYGVSDNAIRKWIDHYGKTD